MKKGFTLIEILSIIVILGIIAVLVLPKISASSTDKKQKEYDKLIELIESAGKSYLSSHPTEVAVEVNTLLSNQYLTNNITNPFTNSNITGCISRKEIDGINKYEFGSTCVGNVSLIVDLDNGNIDTNPAGEYSTGSIITLSIPTKSDFIFAGWEVKSGNSTVSGNTLTIGTGTTTIKAMWGVELIVNLDGGITSQVLEESYASETILTLEPPTKPDYIFAGWAIILGNSTISGNDLTIGIENTTVKAIWTDIIVKYSYTGSVQEFIVPAIGTYKIELWGAQGEGTAGGKGGYTKGLISLEKNKRLYVYVGENPINGTGGYNGGGNAYSASSAGGGGATDVRYENNALKDRIMVAGGGGGNFYSSYISGHGGGLTGKTAYDPSYSTYVSNGGNQTIGGTVVNYSSSYAVGTSGSFGLGGIGGGAAGGGSSGGGGGYYGGGGGSRLNSGQWPAGGGSSFISGYTGCVAVTSMGVPKTGCTTGTNDNSCSIHYSNKVFTNTEMKAGYESMPTHDGESTMTGNSGNGYAKITYVGSE